MNKFLGKDDALEFFRKYLLVLHRDSAFREILEQMEAGAEKPERLAIQCPNGNRWNKDGISVLKMIGELCGPQLTVHSRGVDLFIYQSDYFVRADLSAGEIHQIMENEVVKTQLAEPDRSKRGRWYAILKQHSFIAVQSLVMKLGDSEGELAGYAQSHEAHRSEHQNRGHAGRLEKSLEVIAEHLSKYKNNTTPKHDPMRNPLFPTAIWGYEVTASPRFILLVHDHERGTLPKSSAPPHLNLLARIMELGKERGHLQAYFCNSHYCYDDATGAIFAENDHLLATYVTGTLSRFGKILYNCNRIIQTSCASSPQPLLQL